MNHSVTRRRQALHQTHHHYYLNISVEAANFSDWRIESKKSIRLRESNGIESKLLLPELECSTLSSVSYPAGGFYNSELRMQNTAESHE